MKTNNKNTDTATAPAGELVRSGFRGPMPLEPPARGRRQWLVILALIFSDVLLASLFWGLALIFHSVWGHKLLSEEDFFTYIAPNAAVWIGIRALLGLYPGYGLA